MLATAEQFFIKIEIEAEGSLPKYISLLEIEMNLI
jgi:hypothetical protein